MRCHLEVVYVVTVILLLTSAVGLVAASPLVVINEVMYNPPTSMGSDSNYEWVELYNPNDFSVSVEGWWIGDDEDAGRGSGIRFKEGTMIPPHGYLVVCRNTSAVVLYYSDRDENFNPLAVYTGANATFHLSNSGDVLLLVDADGNVVDRAEYNPTLGANGNGKTLERKPSGEWAEGIKDGGTPTYQNTVNLPFLGGYIVVVAIIALVWKMR